MSQWTHIRGGFELFSTPYEQKKFDLKEPKKEDFEDEESWGKAYDSWRTKWGKSFYLPYPEEQFKLNVPTLRSIWSKDKKGDYKESSKTLDFSAYIFSLPRARKYIEEAFKLLPQGESCFRYTIDQNVHDCTSSCSGFLFPCQYKYYKDALNKMYYREDSWESYTYEELRKYLKIDEECSVDEVNHIIIGVRDDIRYCSGQELLDALEKFFNYLEEHNISVEDGYLEWQDEWDPCYIYAWRNSRLSNLHHQFYKLDKKTNKIIWSKIYKSKRTPEGKIDWDAKDWDIVENCELEEDDD